MDRNGKKAVIGIVVTGCSRISPRSMLQFMHWSRREKHELFLAQTLRRWVDKSAVILVGGQIPYPSVSSTSNSITVEYKPYGISLNLLSPTVDADGNVTTKLLATVSRLDWSNQVSANGYTMPGLTTRSAQTVVNIPSGMTKWLLVAWWIPRTTVLLVKCRYWEIFLLLENCSNIIIIRVEIRNHDSYYATGGQWVYEGPYVE